MSAVDTFFSEHNSYVGTSYAGYVGVVVDRTTNFIFDQIQSLSLSSNLLSGDGNTADTLRSTFYQTVHVRLTSGSDNHDMVSAMPCSHSHTTDVVFETAGCDFSGDDRSRLGIHTVKVLGGGQAHALL